MSDSLGPHGPPDSSVHGISRQEYWSGLPFPSPRDLSDPGKDQTCFSHMGRRILYCDTGLQCYVITGLVYIPLITIEDGRIFTSLLIICSFYFYELFFVCFLTLENYENSLCINPFLAFKFFSPRLLFIFLRCFSENFKCLES